MRDSPSRVTARPGTPQNAHLEMVARGGLINLSGAAVGAILNFVLVTIITRGLGASGAGAFFVAIALFSVMSNTLELGADTGLVRTIPRLRAQDRAAEIRSAVSVALVPVFILAVIAGIAMFAWAVPLADLFGRSDPGAVSPLIRILAIFLPLAATYSVILAGTRGFGSMIPSVVVDKLVKPVAQPAAVAVAIVLGLGVNGVVWGWALAIALAWGIGLMWLSRLLTRKAARAPGAAHRSLRSIGSEFWRFTAPRGLAGFFQVSILWLDTLLIGALRTNQEAGIYSAATRYVLVGTYAIVAILQVLGPKMSELITKRDHEGSLLVYQNSSAWLVLLTWPVYFTCIAFAPVLLSLFGAAFVAAAPAVVIFASAMLVATAIGPVDVVLLMAGKSWWNLINTFVALVANVGLNLLLIPRFGITGAAIAWAVTVLINNILPLAQTWRTLGLHPFGHGLPVACAITASYLVIGLGIRAAAGATIGAFVVYAIVGTATYAALVWRYRGRLELATVVEAVRSRRRRRGARQA